MTVTIDEEQLELMNRALERADELASSVIKGNPSITVALEFARAMNDIKRRSSTRKTQK